MSNLRFVSLFTGAGGLDIGFERAGWECAYASDIDPVATSSLSANRAASNEYFRNSFIETSDVRATRGSDILQKAGLRKGDVQAIVGGPPCQSWSSAGHQLGFEDPRGQLFRDYVRIASEMDVRWLVFENVRGLLTARGPDGEPGSALETIRRALLAAGFQTEVNLLNAADFGVPQRRVRLFMIGFRRGDHPPFPEATHSKSADLFSSGILPWNTLGDCLAELTPLAPGEIIRPSQKLAEQLALVPNGSGLKSPGKKETTRPGGHWGYKQGAFIADLSLPSRTITASAQQDWVRDAEHGLRRLCPRECAALQTFPRDWRFAGNVSAQYRQIGNAVPVELAQRVASALASHVQARFETRSRATSPSDLLPLQSSLRAAIDYTKRDQLRNGKSRSLAPSKRRQRPA